MHIFRPSKKRLTSLKRIGLNLQEELGAEGTYSLYISVVLGFKKSLS